MDKKKIFIIVGVLAIALIAVFAFVLRPSTPNNSNNNSFNQSQNNNSSNQQNVSNNNSNDTSSDVVSEPEKPTTNIEGEKQLDVLVFSDIKIIEEGANENLLVANVKNNGTENIIDGKILFNLFDENNNSIGTVGWTIPFVAADSSTEIKVPIAVNVMYTKNITISYVS